MNKEKQYFSKSLLSWILLTAAVAFFKLGFHELWKDEWQAWFVSRDMNLTQIASFLYYEGHPALWYLYLKVFTLFSNAFSEEVLLSLVHLAVVSAAAWVLFLQHRAPLIFKWMIALSYFFFFEYGIINRGYAFVILFALMAAWQIENKRFESKTLVFSLFLLCQTEVYGAMMALAFGFLVLAQAGFTFQHIHKKVYWSIAAGVVVFIISVFPRSVGHVAKTRGKELSLADSWLTSVQGNLSNAFLPGITKDTFVYGWTFPGLVVSLGLLIGVYWIFRKNKAAMYTVYLFTLMMILFGTWVFLGGIRQWGMGYIFFISILLMQGLDLKSEKIATIIVTLISMVQIIHGFRAVKEDVLIPFTNAKEAGLFIMEKVPEKVPVVAINKFETAPVGGYAKRKFYELPSGTEFSYFRWVDKIYLPTESELKLFARYKNVGGLLVLSPSPLDQDRFPSAQLWKQFTSINYKDENYFLYSLPLK